MTEATTLIVPGRPSESPPDGAGVVGPLWWLLPVTIAGLAAWGLLGVRRRRRIDPRERAFRRIAQTQGWSRATTRAVRRAALGLESPVGIALSPALTATAVAAQDPGHPADPVRASPHRRRFPASIVRRAAPDAAS